MPIDETLATVVSCEGSREFLLRMGINGEIIGGRTALAGTRRLAGGRRSQADGGSQAHGARGQKGLLSCRKIRGAPSPHPAHLPLLSLEVL